MTVNRLAESFSSLVTGTMGKGYGVRDYQIDRIVTLFLDLDPTRDHPLGGKVCATETEHAAATALAWKIADFARSLGWLAPLVMDSGSGAYVILRVDLPNNRESVALIENVLKAFADKFDSPAVHVDTGVSNPSRVVRIAGTWNRKSQHTEERPNRAVRILSAPDRLEVVSVEQLNAFAQTDIAPKETNETTEEICFDERDAVRKEQEEAVLKYLQRAGIKPDSVDGRFTLPQSTRDMQEQLLAASAPLQLFLEECCELDSRKGVHSVALYRIYTIWLAETHPGEEPISESNFPDELRAAASTVTKKRAKKPGERLRDGCALVETAFDAEPHVRAWMWLGICPKSEYRGEIAANDISPVGAHAISPPAWSLDRANATVSN